MAGHCYLPEWARHNGHAWDSTLVPAAESLPAPSDFDVLVVLGGPMSAWEVDRYPWLMAEKSYLETVVAAGKPVLGICLGAQLLAGVLGARTYGGPHKEIGWFPVETTPEGRGSWPGAALPERFVSYLWHGDTYDLPDGAVRIARSAAFENQGFLWNQVLALQFHLEVRPEWVRMLAERDARELVPKEFVQSAETILAQPESLYRENNRIMDGLLHGWLDAVACAVR